MMTSTRGQRIGSSLLAFVLAAALGQPTARSEETLDCPAVVADAPLQSMGTYMAKMRMHEPMPGEMKKPGMMKEDVAKAAMQKGRCMNDVLTREQSIMDRTSSGSKPTQ